MGLKFCERPPSTSRSACGAALMKPQTILIALMVFGPACQPRDSIDSSQQTLPASSPRSFEVIALEAHLQDGNRSRAGFKVMPLMLDNDVQEVLVATQESKKNGSRGDTGSVTYKIKTSTGEVVSKRSRERPGQPSARSAARPAEVIALETYLQEGLGSLARQRGLGIQVTKTSSQFDEVFVGPLDFSKGLGSPRGYESVTIKIKRSTGEIVGKTIGT